MKLYSYKGQNPEILPFRIRLDDGSTRTSLEELSDDELEEFGFVGPIVKPDFDENSQIIEWNGSEYVVTDLTEEQIKFRQEQIEADKHNRNIQNVSYGSFLNLFLKSEIYKKIRNFSIESPENNSIFSEFIILLCNAAAGNLNISSIQNYLNILFLLIDFSPEDILEINDLFLQTHLRYFLSVPDEEFRSTHTYDYSKNIIISPQPYPSWVLVNGVWEAPFPAPVDYEGNSYVWDETITNWVQI